MIPSASVIRIATRLMRYTPAPMARTVAVGAGWVAWAALARRRRILHVNLEHSAPDRTSGERRRLVRRTFSNMAATAVDQFRLPSLAPERLLELFEVRGLEHVDTALQAGRGLVMVTGHLGPYELAAAWMAARGYKVAGMMEDLSPDLLEALATYRSATGMVLVNMKDGLRAAYRLLNEGYMLCLVADRTIGESRGAIEVPFLGDVRRLPIGPAVFAQGTGAPIITGFASLNPARRPRYLVELDAPIFAAGRDAAERDRLVRHIAGRMEAAIRRHPDEWYVFQPEWISRGAA